MLLQVQIVEFPNREFYRLFANGCNIAVYVGSGDGKIYALDATTGVLLWEFQTGSVVHSVPAVAGGTVYIGSDDGNVYALSASKGKMLWSYQTRNYVVSSPAVVNNVVYIGSGNGKLYALNATTRRQGMGLWMRI